MHLSDDEMADVEAVVRKHVPNADADLMSMRLSDFAIDSMGMVTMMFDIEDVIGFEIDLEKIAPDKTLDQFIASLEHPTEDA